MQPIEPAELEPQEREQTPAPPADDEALRATHTVAPTGRSARIRLGDARYGNLAEHELVHLLDTIEDERSRARFRESIYISLFVWIAIAWFALYGPRLLWHQKLISPVDAIRQHEMTMLTAPDLRPHTIPHIENKLDSRTLEHLRRSEPPTPRPQPAPQPTPQPRTEAEPQPRAETRPAPQPETRTPAAAEPAAAPQPHTPSAGTTPVPEAPKPAPRQPAAAVPDAPRPQPHVNFGNQNQSAGDQVASAARDSARSAGGGFSASSGRHGYGSSAPVSMGGAEILSDTQGVNFRPYLSRILDDIYRNWIPLIPEEARPPLNKQGETYIRFSIGPDGRILAMHLDGSTHDDAINRSCWGSITSEGQFPPLPSQFHGPELELRIHYLVNKGNGE